MKTRRVLTGTLLAGALMVPVGALALSGGSATADGPNFGLTELTPSVQYKVDVSNEENDRLKEWYTDQGIEFSEEEGDGGSYVIADDMTKEAGDARFAFYDVIAAEDAKLFPYPYPPAEMEAVNAETEAQLKALTKAGTKASAPLDEEGFKDLTVDIKPTDPDAQAQWNKADAVIAGLGN